MEVIKLCVFTLLFLCIVEGKKKDKKERKERKEGRKEKAGECDEEMCKRALETMRVPKICIRSQLCMRKFVKEAKFKLKSKGKEESEKARSGREKCKDDLTILNNRLNKTNQTNTQLREKLIALQKEKETYKQKMIGLKSEVASLKKSNTQLKENINKVETLSNIRSYNLTLAANLIKSLEKEKEILENKATNVENKLKASFSNRFKKVNTRADQCEENINRLTVSFEAKHEELNVCLQKQTALQQKLEKESLLVKMREDLENCLTILKDDEDTSSDSGKEEDCVSPCTITRGSGTVKGTGDMKSSRLISDLTLQNQRLKQELNELSKRCGDIELEEESDVPNQTVPAPVMPLIGANQTNENVDHTIEHVVDILKSFAPKTASRSEFQLIQNRISKGNK